LGPDPTFQSVLNPNSGPKMWREKKMIFFKSCIILYNITQPVLKGRIRIRKDFPDLIRAAKKVPNTPDRISSTEILFFEDTSVSWDSIKVIVM
jgi:hypothetical protein